MRVMMVLAHSHVGWSPAEVALAAGGVVAAAAVVVAGLLVVRWWLRRRARGRVPCPTCGTFLDPGVDCPVCARLRKD